MSDFRLKRWRVDVHGYGTATYDTPSRGKALAQAWRSDAFSSVSFRAFMSMARCRREECTPDRWGDPISVDGKPAFYVGGTRASVAFVRPNEDVVMLAHPYDVLPVKYRPEQYRAPRNQEDV